MGLIECTNIFFFKLDYVHMTKIYIWRKQGTLIRKIVEKNLVGKQSLGRP